MSTREGAPRADVARNREGVLAAALAVFSRDPEASMREVADASGLGRTTVYRHFPNRDALVRALFEQVFDRAVVDVGAILDAVDEPREVLPRVATATLAIADQYRFLAAHQAVGDEVRRRPRADPLLVWIEAQLAAGRLRPLGAPWIHGMVVALIVAATEEIHDGRASAADA
ncbi:MAG: helix-turn-helix domain-containing protein, partial [Solirubrobacteraceae bacterium]|nr:helix-turn-helix domain-containing protein [Patulibacter sp.]